EWKSAVEELDATSGGDVPGVTPSDVDELVVSENPGEVVSLSAGVRCWIGPGGAGDSHRCSEDGTVGALRATERGPDVVGAVAVAGAPGQGDLPGGPEREPGLKAGVRGVFSDWRGPLPRRP